MVKRYPHIMTVTVAGEATLDANGNWVPGSPATSEHACRFGTNAKNLLVRAQDGTQVVYDGIVYTRKVVETIALGAQVEVRDEAGAVVARGTVKQVVNSSFNTKIWL